MVFDFPSYFPRGEQGADPEAALEFLAKHCQWAVVTLGPNGCIAKHEKEVSGVIFLFSLFHYIFDNLCKFDVITIPFIRILL